MIIQRTPLPFYNRTQEMRFLATQTPADHAALVVLYGRRRLGKTSLLREFARNRRSVFFVADMASRSDQLAAFSRVAFEQLGEAGLAGTVLPSWESALRFAGDRARTTPLLLVLDEFSYLCDSDPSLPSVIQRLWDDELRHTRLHLVLCGSYVSFMEREVLGAKNPLFGRRTGEWILQPFGFQDTRLFSPDRSTEDQVRIYGVLGGSPAYLERFDPGASIRDNIIRHILTRGSALYSEPRFLLMQELRDPHTYFSICRAVAFGRTTPNEIAQGAGVADRGVVSRYLQTLRELNVLERRTPVTEQNPERTRRGRYRLADAFLRFWFRFVLPNVSSLEVGDAEMVYDTQVAPHIEQQVSVTFEDVARQHLALLHGTGRLPGSYLRIGSWWRGNAEVDVVGLADDGALLLGEVKWSTRAVGTDILDALKARAPVVAGDLSTPPTRVTYCLWSRSGYTPALRHLAETEHILLFGLDDLRPSPAE